MTGKSIEVRTTDSARYDPMDDTWLALIAHAGVVMRLFDPGNRFFGFRGKSRLQQSTGAGIASGRSSAVNNDASNHSRIEKDPSDACKVDRLVALLNPVDKPQACGEEIRSP